VTLSALALTLHPLAGAAERLVPPLSLLQFPWRFLTVATCGGAAAMGFAAARLVAVRRFRSWAVGAPLALLILVIIDGAPYTGAADWFAAQ
jgi:hypothetical protein